MRVLPHNIEELARLGAPNIVVLEATPASVENLVEFAEQNHAAYLDGANCPMFLVQFPGAPSYLAMDRTNLERSLAAVA